MKDEAMNEQLGRISEIRYVALGAGKQCEVKVLVDDRDTNWLPYTSTISSAFKAHIPPREGDQVRVVNHEGKNEDGHVDNNIAYDGVPHHELIDEDNIIFWAEDGTIYKHNLKEKTIEIETPCDVKITAPKIEFFGVVSVNGKVI